MQNTLMSRRLKAGFAVAAAAIAYTFVPVSIELTAAGPVLGLSQAFAKNGKDDPAGHERRGRGKDDDKSATRHGKDDPAGDDHGRHGRGKDDPAGDDHGRHGRGKDDPAGDDRGRGGHGKDD